MAVCEFDGNSDMYGIGIRIGFYLQWYGAILASWLSPLELPNIQFSINVFIVATFIALLIQLIRDVSRLEVVEVYIILLLAFGYFLRLVPLYTLRFLIGYNPTLDLIRYPRVTSSTLYEYLTFTLLVAMVSLQLWFWIARVPSLNPRSCQEYGFLFTKTNLDMKVFSMLSILFYSLLLLACLIVLFISLGKKFGVIEDLEAPKLRYILQTIKCQLLNVFTGGNALIFCRS